MTYAEHAENAVGLHAELEEVDEADGVRRWELITRANTEAVLALAASQQDGVAMMGTYVEAMNAAVAAEQKKVPRADPPHARACGMAPHAHGSACHSNCPSCGGHDLDRGSE